ncbi:STE3-domain-containing protein [Pluteus cervinus]|uniref:STE3-domain-containing protein n=1 Tax=Pluteus cervinus TaxID=181527 RepID=A0ACD3AI09_9AGAR|nr:STE3-domain-containing protein [Pluteus cervinus]
MKYPALPIFAFLSAVLVLIPLPWHWRARNVATLSIVVWLFAVDVIYGVNALVWADNFRVTIPVWCDITTKIVVGASYALPLANLCICKHLEMVSSSRKASYDVRDKRRRMIFEGVLCFGLPLVFMALHYIVQGHRYDLFENTGCVAAVYISVPAIMLIWFPPLLFSVIALVYAAMALHHFIQRRLTFAAHLQNSNSALTTNRYLRLIAMAITQMVWGTALTTYILYENVFPGLRPWTNWADVHSNFSRVDLFPAFTIPPYFMTAMMFLWGAIPASSFIFFVFFGFGEEAMKEYRCVWAWIRRVILRHPAETKAGLKGGFPKTHRPLKLPAFMARKAEADIEKQTHAVLSSRPPSITTVAPTSPTKSELGAYPLTEITDNLSYFSHDEESTACPTTPSTPSTARSTTATTADTPTTPDYRISASIYQAYLDAHAAAAAGDLSLPSSRSSSTSFPPSSAATPPPPEHHTQVRDGVPSPPYHRPFSPPSAYPVSQPHPRAAPQGLWVTVHRQASADEIV